MRVIESFPLTLHIRAQYIKYKHLVTSVLLTVKTCLFFQKSWFIKILFATMINNLMIRHAIINCHGQLVGSEMNECNFLTYNCLDLPHNSHICFC